MRQRPAAHRMESICDAIDPKTGDERSGMPHATVDQVEFITHTLNWCFCIHLYTNMFDVT